MRRIIKNKKHLTPGRDPVQTEGDDQEALTHQEAGRQIGGCHSSAAQISGLVECTVTHP
jgi:hypothetical protein